jgi:hypothetical protein
MSTKCFITASENLCIFDCMPIYFGCWFHSLQFFEPGHTLFISPHIMKLKGFNLISNYIFHLIQEVFCFECRLGIPMLKPNRFLIIRLLLRAI